MSGEQKITSEHLARRAVVYLRQSSPGQVKHNIESQRMQYALAQRARDLGFRDVETIDADLGVSAAVAAKRRAGFERLLGAVASRTVGLILSRELSRLSRTDKDFCQLVELCQIFGTLVGDDETIYDVSHMDDALVLGIKATMSVAELRVLRMRLKADTEHKARRGELYQRSTARVGDVDEARLRDGPARLPALLGADALGRAHPGRARRHPHSSASRPARESPTQRTPLAAPTATARPRAPRRDRRLRLTSP